VARPSGFILVACFPVLLASHAAGFAEEPASKNPSGNPAGPTTSQQLELARTYLNKGNYGDAERCLRIALTGAEGDQETGRIVRISLADLLREKGRLPEARQMYSEVLTSPGVTSRQKFDALAGLADMDGASGNARQSAVGWNEALQIAQEEHSSSMEADALRGLGKTWLDDSNPVRAQPVLRRSLEMLESDSTAEPGAVASVLMSLGVCYRLQNKLALAEDVLLRALETDRKAFGEAHPQVGIIMERLAEVYALRKKFTLARDYSTRALGVMRACCGEHSAAVAVALVNRAVVEQQASSLKAAADNYAAALRTVQQDSSSESFNPVLEARIIERYVVVLKETHRDKEARDLSAMAVSINAQHPSRD
jgi:tetratricopeptide (TPR) repeat protein